jgi:hypothetical protein
MSNETISEDESKGSPAPKASGRGGLVIALSFIAGLVLLVALNMR